MRWRIQQQHLGSRPIDEPEQGGRVFSHTCHGSIRRLSGCTRRSTRTTAPRNDPTTAKTSAATTTTAATLKSVS